MHLPFDRTERLFSRGQGLRARGDLDGAVDALRAAAAADPRYPQIQLHLALALADRGEVEAADAALAAAMAIDPRSPLYPAERGVLALDDRRPADALAWFDRAVALDGGNPLIAAWPELARWDQGDEQVLPDLDRRCRDHSRRFQSRVWVRLERYFAAGRKPSLPPGAIGPPERFRPGFWIRLVEAPWKRARARRLMARGRMDEAAMALREMQADYEGEELLGGMLADALQGAVLELEKRLEEHTRRRVSATDGLDALEESRREILFDLADTLLEQKRWDRARPVLEEWRDSWAKSGRPAGERSSAALVTLAAGEVAIRQGRWDEALSLATHARELEPEMHDAHRVSGQAYVGLGEERLARLAFERFLGHGLWSVQDRLRELVTGVSPPTR